MRMGQEFSRACIVVGSRWGAWRSGRGALSYGCGRGQGGRGRCVVRRESPGPARDQCRATCAGRPRRVAPPPSLSGRPEEMYRAPNSEIGSQRGMI